jgi:hypothetical protein
MSLSLTFTYPKLSNGQSANIAAYGNSGTVVGTATNNNNNIELHFFNDVPQYEGNKIQNFVYPQYDLIAYTSKSYVVSITGFFATSFPNSDPIDLRTIEFYVYEIMINNVPYIIATLIQPAL